jgi:hypothetical protein
MTGFNRPELRLSYCKSSWWLARMSFYLMIQAMHQMMNVFLYSGKNILRDNGWYLRIQNWKWTCYDLPFGYTTELPHLQYRFFLASFVMFILSLCLWSILSLLLVSASSIYSSELPSHCIRSLIWWLYTVIGV